MKRAAAITAAGLSLLFIAVYGGANWITSQRADVGTWVFAWEQHMPFVPWMIVPYMSIDLFFVAAPFLCRDRQELRTLRHRISFAILVAGACFLLVPLTLAFPRPEVSGWTGAIFRVLHGFDQPYNLFPSLHMTLRTLLAAHYARHTRGVMRWVVHGWFSLIALSTVLTWQHHLVDVIGGYALGIVTLYLFRQESLTVRGTRNLRVGGYYAAGGLIATALALAGWPWTGILLWPALSMGIVAAGYFGLGPAIYHKESGRLTWSAHLMLAPCLVGQWLSLLHYRRQCAGWSMVTPQVWIGARLAGGEAEEARRAGVTAVLDLTAEFSESKAFAGLSYLNLQVLDLTAPTQAQLREAVAFISTHAAGGIVYVHCKVGYSRSAAAVGAWLLASGSAADVPQTLRILHKARPSIVIRPETISALRVFHQPSDYPETVAFANDPDSRIELRWLRL
jgi:membrane-associated phospholipid phosphatase